MAWLTILILALILGWLNDWELEDFIGFVVLAAILNALFGSNHDD